MGYTNQELLEMLEEFYNEYGFVKTTALNEDDRFPSSATYYVRFGSLNEAMEKAEIGESIDSSGRGRNKLNKRDHLLKQLKEHAKKVDGINTKTVNEDDSMPTPAPFYNEFGSLEKACEEAGVKYTSAAPEKTTRDEVIEHLKICYSKYGSTKQEFFKKDDDLCCFSSIYNHFDSIHDARDVAGIDENPYPKKYTDEELIESMRKCYKKHGKTTTGIFNSDDELPPASNFSRLGGINSAREKAGVPRSKNNGEKYKVMSMCPNYEENDGYVYVLELEDNSYYVGESCNLPNRLEYHCYDKNISDVYSIESIDMKNNESSEEFKERLRERERERKYEVAIEENTTDVYGG